jgi:hypothetical protein
VGEDEGVHMGCISAKLKEGGYSRNRKRIKEFIIF